MSHSEFDIIRRYFAQSGLAFPREGVANRIGDDAALLKIPDSDLLAMSMDLLVESVHFPAGADAAAVGYRALAVNLSDLAAMAATPLCFTLGLSLPRADEAWLAGFSAGLLELAQQFNCPLVGGDLVRGPLSIAIQVQGLVTPDRVLRREGARVGDDIYVSGTLGDAAIALVSFGLDAGLGSDFAFLPGQPEADCETHFHAAYYRPQPRIDLARALAPFVTSGLDLSDGLAGDLGHLLAAGAVGARLETAALPLSGPAERAMSRGNGERAALYGGDDYELCVTVSPANRSAAEAAAAAVGVRFTRIGKIVADPGLQLVDGSGADRVVTGAAYQHFHQD